MSELNIVFAGTTEFSAKVLAALLKSKFQPCAVYTQPDRASGRGRKIQMSPVKALALEHTVSLPIEQPQTFKDPGAVARLAELQPDILVVVAYGLLLPEAVLAIPPLASLNIHASLLPRWRGAAPIERAYMAGDQLTGIGIMEMEAGLDTGPVYTERQRPITPGMAIDVLEQQLCEDGIDALLEVLEGFQRAEQGAGAAPTPTPQTENGATYARKLTAADRELDWTSTAEALSRQVGALANRMPVRASICEIHKPVEPSSQPTQKKGLQILNAQAMPEQITQTAPGTIVSASKEGIDVACGNGLLRITQVKIEGKASVLNAADAINGHGQLFQLGNQLLAP